MRNFLLALFAMFFVSGVWAKDCKITYVNEGFTLMVMDGNFKSVASGSTVPDGTNLMIALSCNNGYSLKSFLINGEEYKDELYDYDQAGRDYQYSYRVTDDTHFEAISEVSAFPVVYGVKGDGALQLYVGDEQAQSGAIVEYNSEVTVKAVAQEGSELVEFRVNGLDRLNDLSSNGNQLTVQVYEKTSFEAVFTGEGNPDGGLLPVEWYVYGEGSLQVQCGTKSLVSGDKVLKGDYIDVRAVPVEGFMLESLKVNGEDRTGDMKSKLTLQVLEIVNLEAVFVEIPPKQYWKDLAAENFAGGEGTEQAPYQIATAEQLSKVANDVFEGLTDYSDTWFELSADIDLAGNDWFPIGYNSISAGEYLFCGKFDGNGYKILNLTISPIEEHSCAGLFGSTGESFELRNLTIESGTIVGGMIAGAFVGFNRGIIEDCVNRAGVACDQFYCGGIAGSSIQAVDGTLSAVIRRCQNFGKVDAGNGNYNGFSAGGIVASNSSIVEECVNWGEVTSPVSGAGGIVSIVEGGIVRHCFNRGYVHSAEQAGGIIASAFGRSGDCEIYNNYSASQLEAAETSCGGVIGVALLQEQNLLRIADCYFDASLYGGEATGSLDNSVGTYEIGNIEGLETQVMQSADFLIRLNNETKDGAKWAEDTEDMNDGYPILAFMSKAGSYIEGVYSDNGVAVYAAEGRIVVDGVAADAAVYVYTVSGVCLYAGSVADLSSCSLVVGLYMVSVDGTSYKVIVH